MSFMIETSARHIHLTQETVEKLFGESLSVADNHCPIPASTHVMSV